MLLNPTHRNLIVNQIAGRQREATFSADLHYRIDPATGLLGPTNDLNLVTRTGGGWQVTENTFRARFKPWATDDNLVVFEHDPDQDTPSNRADAPVRVSLTPVHLAWANEEGDRDVFARARRVSGDVGGAQVMYPGAFGPGLDLQYRVDTDQIAKFLHIRDRGDLPVPSAQVRAGTKLRLQVVFELATDAARVFMEDTDEWDGVSDRREIKRAFFRDTAKNTSRFFFDEPYAEDSAHPDSGGPDTQTCRFRFWRGPNNLFVAVECPASWLNNATYPVKIDPTEKWGNGSVADNVVTAENRGARHFPSTTSNAHVYKSDTGSGAYCWETLFRIDTSLLYGATITNGNLNLYQTGTGGWTSSVPIVRMLRAWTTSATHATYNGTNNWTSTMWRSSGNDYSGTYFNWSAGTNSTYNTSSSSATMLQSDADNSRWFSAGSLYALDGNTRYTQNVGCTGASAQRPYLSVTYTAPASSNPVAMML